MEARAGARHGVRIGVLAVLHKFNGRLEFSLHVHTMVTGGGLHRASNTWTARAYFEHDAPHDGVAQRGDCAAPLALEAKQLQTEASFHQVEELLCQQEGRRWIINIQSFKSKEHFLRYAGRYVRRPPIPQRRITSVKNGTVTFWAKDKKLRRRVYRECSLEEFVNRWAQHIPERVSAGSSQLRAVCAAFVSANLCCGLRNSRAASQTTSETPPLGGIHQTGFR